MPNAVLPQIHGDALVISLLDRNGVPLPSGNGYYCTHALTKVTFKPQYSDGDAIQENTASGSRCINFKDDDLFDGIDADIELCSPDAYAAHMLAGGTLLTEVSAQVPGYAFPPMGKLSGNGVSIEVYAKRIDDDDLDSDFPYARYVLPKLKRARIGDRAFERALANNVFTGRAIENPNWFDGPMNDWPAASDRVCQWLPWASIPAATPAPTTLPAS